MRPDRGYRLEAHRLALRQWPDAGLTQDQEPGLRATVTY